MVTFFSREAKKGINTPPHCFSLFLPAALESLFHLSFYFVFTESLGRQGKCYNNHTFRVKIIRISLCWVEISGKILVYCYHFISFLAKPWFSSILVFSKFLYKIDYGEQDSLFRRKYLIKKKAAFDATVIYDFSLFFLYSISSIFPFVELAPLLQEYLFFDHK